MTTSTPTSPSRYPDVATGPSYTDSVGYTLATAFTVDADVTVNGFYVQHPTGATGCNLRLLDAGGVILSSYNITLEAGLNYIDTGDLALLHPGVNYRIAYGQPAPAEYFALPGLGGQQFGHIILAAQPGRFSDQTLGDPGNITSNFYGVGVYTVPDVPPVLQPAQPFLFGSGVFAEGGRMLAQALLIDTIQIMNVGEPVTVGHNVTRALTPVSVPIPGLVQTTSLANAVESLVDSIYSVKVSRGTEIKAGQAVKVVTCVAEPSLVGKVLLLDKVSQNGLAMLRKGVASDAQVVNQEGKEALA